MRATLILVALALTTSCASGTKTAGPSVPVPSATGPVTWTSGTVLRGTVTIPAGSTVTLAKDAVVKVADGAKLVLAGTLSGGSLVGGSWEGIEVPKGATGTLNGVKVVGAQQTVVAGTLVGRHVSYDKGGTSGIVLSPGSALRLSDSLLFGNGKYQGDMITSDSAREVTVTRTEVRDVHCAFHLVGVDALALDTLSLHDNAYGFMAYGSKPGVTHTIRNTDNYDNRDYGLLETPGVDQGTIVVDGGYWGRSGSGVATVLAQASGKIQRLHPAVSPRAGAR